MSRANGVMNSVPDAQAPSKAAEIGWTFVPQYYTCMNQDPSRLHCFYTKKSTLVHADEKEEAQPCFGQQEIHQRLQALEFDNTKVYVSTVDSQASADGGIIIQVIGEMSNKGGNWRKFSQTFFLAQQPNGYYVLNDIFRYLSDETETAADNAAEEPVAAPEAAKEAAKETQPEPVPVQQPAAPVANEAPVAVPAQEAVKEAPKEAAQPAAPVRKTWANLAATGATKWGTAPPAAAPASVPSPAAAPAAAKPRAQPAAAAPAAPGTQVFVKNVVAEHATNDALKHALEAQFGATKECQVNPTKGHAFVEFTSADAARRAVAAGSLQVGSAAVQIEKRRGNERGSGGGRGRGGARGGRGGSSA